MAGTFETKLQEWAKSAVEYCHDVATNKEESKRIDKAFYAFQSKPVSEPEVLILGINPGENKKWNSTYASQIKNWVNIENRMTPEVFIKENPFWTEHGSWALWKGLFGIFKAGKIDYFLQGDKFMYMNVLYFNSNTITAFYKLSKNSREVFNTCKDYSIKLIVDIIRPKRIICLSIPSCFNNISEIENVETIYDKILVRGTLKNIPIYGIPHTSYPIKGGRFRIGKLLNDLFEKDQKNPISKEELINKNKELFDLNYQPSVNILDLNNLVIRIKNQILSKKPKFIKNQKDNGTTVDLIITNDIEMRITATGKGYVAVRVSQKLDNNKIKDILFEKGYRKANGWLALKPLKTYNSNDALEISKVIFEEINDLLNI